ncbi:MAG: YbjN domain-containing protein [Clostridia bacterium]|nr:YbjN domain-containing protein [Clostridia bacterium]
MEANYELARVNFDTLCKNLDDHGWHYDKDLDNLKIDVGCSGDDMPMDLRIRVDPKRQLISVLSLIPTTTPEDKRFEMAVAVSIVNNKLADGCFDFDINDGSLFFRISNSFIDTVIGSEAFSYMLIVSFKTIDEYNDKFLMLNKGLISVENFI